MGKTVVRKNETISACTRGTNGKRIIISLEWYAHGDDHVVLDCSLFVGATRKQKRVIRNGTTRRCHRRLFRNQSTGTTWKDWQLSLYLVKQCLGTARTEYPNKEIFVTFVGTDEKRRHLYKKVLPRYLKDYGEFDVLLHTEWDGSLSSLYTLKMN